MKSTLNIKALVITILLLTSALVFPQKKSGPPASFDGNALDFEELKNRFEFMPQQKIPGTDGEMLQKRNFLLSLVSEKLWAEEGKQLGIDTTKEFKQIFNPLMRAFYRDMLFKLEIENKVNVTDLDLIRAFQKAKTTLRINFLFSTDSSEIFNLYTALNSGIKFDTLFAGRQETEMQLSPIEIEYGKTDEAVENVFYSLINPGDYSGPFPDKGNWYIFYLRERAEKTLSAEERDKVNSFIRRLLHDRQVEKYYSDFYRKFFGSKRVETDGYLFRGLVGKIESVYTARTDTTAESLKLSAGDIIKIKKTYTPDSLSLPFILFSPGPLSLNDFLDNLSYETFKTDSVTASGIARKLSAYVKRIIEYELLYREAKQRNLSDFKEDLTQLEIWREYYLSYMAKQKYFDSVSVTEDEALALYNRQVSSGSGIVKLNIAEILTDSLNVIEDVLNSLSSKADFGSLAKRYTQRDSLKSRSGVWGLLPVSQLGELGTAASGLKLGEVFGPVRTGEGYHIIKLLDRVEEKASLSAFSEVKEQYKQEAHIDKYKNLINGKTAAFAASKNLKVDLSKAINSELKSNNMVVFKLLGFGGKILAFPVTMPHTEWYDTWQKRKKELP